jgi:hypothetical protein
VSEPTVYPLKKVITAHGEEVAELRLREGTTADARALKSLPYYVQADGETVALNLDVCAKYISRLAGIPLSSVDQLCLSDLNALAWAVTGPFLQQDSVQ